MSHELRFRQVHLDFHTSPAIPGIGADFDPDEFAQTLERAHVNSVTCFARCHHGHVYFPSTAHPERVHPNLARPNLLGDQIAACHARGIRVPIYITVQWDEFTADRHRDWLCIDDEGREYGTRPLDPGFYRNLDVFHPGYRAFLFEHVREVLTNFEVDGLFFDIVQPRPSLALHWIEAMDAAGKNPEDATERQRFAEQVIYDFESEMTHFVRRFHPTATIFYNAGHVGTRHRHSRESYSHYELESLPSGGWGYLHFPQAQRYARTLGKACLGMTGKFHTTWGDFGSFKNPAALQFECFHMLALGAQCSIGDQLPPSGKLDAATYDLIGGVYADVAAKEPWCHGAVPVVDVALMTTEEWASGYHPHGGADTNNVLGAIRMLQELNASFDIVDSHSDLSRYRLLILPDDVSFDAALTARVDAFLERGGAVIATHRSGLDADGHFASAHFGVRNLGDAPFSPDFFVPGETIGAGLPDVGHVMYRRALEVEAEADALVLARVETPYFNRTWRHFCSHNHTPSSGQAGYPAAVQKNRLIYFAHPLFRMYFERAPRWVKTVFADALAQLLPDPVLAVRGPSSLLAALNYQPTRERHVVHLLHYVPERRGREFDVIEDVIPIFDIAVGLRLSEGVHAIHLVPDGPALSFETVDGQVRFTVPRVDGHAIIEVR